jgi:polycystin 1L2
MLLIFYFGFAQMGYLAFSVDVDEFRTFGRTLLTLFRSLVGDLDYDTLYDANRVVGPIFYIAFYTLMLLVLVNVFIAILGDAHQTIVQEDQEKEVGAVSVEWSDTRCR